jgi:segregation and condensation protein B
MTDQNAPEDPSQPDQASDEGRIISIEQARGASPESPESETDAPGTEMEVPEPGELDFKEITTIIEALLFAASNPLTTKKLSNLAGAGGARTARKAVEALREEYDRNQKPYTVSEIDGGFRLLTRPEFDTWVGKLRKKEQSDTLSQAALETLAIVAYRQPIMRADIEDIRGVQSGYILRSLIEKSLVRVAGRSEELGRPLLYATTGKFLDAFGLASLDELPELDDLDAGK